MSFCIMTLTYGCGGGGGGASAPDVVPGPPPANSNPPAPDPLPPAEAPNTYEEADTISAFITGVSVDSPPVLELTVVDGQGIAVTGLRTSNIRFTIAKLVPGSNGGAAYWQSYINRVKTPAVVPENDPGIQATSESGGELVDHGDGTYTYTFLTDITSVEEPLAVPYEPDLTHRVAIQFGGGPVANPVFDWVPANGETVNLLRNEVVTTASCNTCHDPLALHGGGRVELKYCVTCHNPGTTEPNSLTSMDLKVMIHKIHMGENLPSVQAGGEYVIYGFRDSRHDYSNIKYPQSLLNCTKCHAGTGTVDSSPFSTDSITSEGDNWNERPTIAACGSCHDDLDFTSHFGGQNDDSGCSSCHSVMGQAGSVVSSHRHLVQEAMAEYSVNILSIDNTGVGEFPAITFSVTNPLEDDAPYDIATDVDWVGARLSAGVAFSTSDFTNTGNGESHPSYSQTDALANSVSNGDGTYTLIASSPIPDGSDAPGRAATGSGMVTFEGHPRKDLGEPGAPDFQDIPFLQPHRFFSIDESDGEAVSRRQVVSIDKCNVCHAVKINHGLNRSNNITACAGCHNPRNTDKAVRDVALSPPTDGKSEETIDFKVLIHALHASAYREEPFQVVGFGGFSTHVFDEEEVQYPGRLDNCTTCHTGNSFELPLAEDVLATTVDSGDDSVNPADDLMVTAASSVCGSCHDSVVSAAHMQQNGGDFSATETSIASGVSTEACEVCHGPGRQADVSVVHGLE